MFSEIELRRILDAINGEPTRVSHTFVKKNMVRYMETQGDSLTARVKMQHLPSLSENREATEKNIRKKGGGRSTVLLIVNRRRLFYNFQSVVLTTKRPIINLKKFGSRCRD